MIRPLIITSTKGEFNRKTETIEKIARLFASYLETYIPAKESQAKHTRMGPVGKILSRMRSGRSGSPLLGDAIRYHQMSAKRRDGSISQITAEGYENLKKAIESLDLLVKSSSTSEKNTVLSLVDSAVYFVLEERRQERIRKKRDEFRKYVLEMYGTIEAVRQAWEAGNLTFEEIPYPSNNIDKRKKNSWSVAKVKEDIEKFLNLKGEKCEENELEDEIE